MIFQPLFFFITPDFRIQNLVAAAEIESGEVAMTTALVDPLVLVDEAIEALRYTIKAKKCTVTVESTLKQKIVSDPQKLYLILKNLLANGCIYGPEGGRVEVEIGEKDSMVTFAVKNQGRGPEVEFKPQVFTRFAHGPEGGHGLGLGLSIVRDVCERFGGSVDYHTDETSVTFTVTFPLKTALPDSEACGSNEFLFESFDDAIEL